MTSAALGLNDTDNRTRPSNPAMTTLLSGCLSITHRTSRSINQQSFFDQRQQWISEPLDGTTYSLHLNDDSGLGHQWEKGRKCICFTGEILSMDGANCVSIVIEPEMQCFLHAGPRHDMMAISAIGSVHQVVSQPEGPIVLLRTSTREDLELSFA